MTLSEIRNSDIDFLYPKDVCEVLQCHPYSTNALILLLIDKGFQCLQR